MIVSFFTRDYGRVRGVAKSALMSRKRFGGALEPMTVARAWFAERPRQELVRLDQLEIRPLAALVADRPRAPGGPQLFCRAAGRGAARARSPGDGLPPVCWQSLEPRPRPKQPWMPLTYFPLWMTRLMGLLPDIAHCTACGEVHEPAKPASTRSATACSAPIHRTGNSSALSADSWQLAQRMLRPPVAAFAAEPWPRRRAQDLRRFTLQALERHLERKLRSAEALARLGV